MTEQPEWSAVPDDHEQDCPAYVPASWTAAKQAPSGPCSCLLLHLQEAVK